MSPEAPPPAISKVASAESKTARRAAIPLAADIIIANAPDPVFVSDLEGKILQANDAVFELLGFRPAELIDVLVGDQFGIALVRVFAEREGRILGGQFQAFTYRIQNGKVAEFWFMVEDRYAVDAFWS